MTQSSKRQRYSELWNFFTPIEDDYFATCNMCKRKLSFKTTNSNLKKHLNSNHPAVLLPSSVAHLCSAKVEPLTSHPSSSDEQPISCDVPKDSRSCTSLQQSSGSSFAPKKEDSVPSGSLCTSVQQSSGSIAPKKGIVSIYLTYLGCMLFLRAGIAQSV